MNRRQFITMSALSIYLSGCIEGNFGGTTEDDTPTVKATGTNTPTNTATETETPFPEGETPECWPSLCEGTQLVKVVVTDDFSGDVVLKAECRAEEFSIPTGESVRIVRKEDAEACNISLSVNGEPAVSEYIEDYESVALTVSSNSEVDEEWVAQ